MASPQDYFDTWLKSQKQLFEGFLENTRKTQELFLGQSAPAASPGAEGFNHVYSAWNTAVLKSLADTGNSNLHILRDNLYKMLGSSNAYLKLYELWLPLLKATHEKTLNAMSFKTLVDPVQYKAMMDAIFGFDAEAMKLMINEGSQLLELYSNSSRQFAKPWSEAAKNSLDAVPQCGSGHPEALIKMFHSLFNAFDNTFGRVFHVPPVGKDREKIELLMRCLDDLSVYVTKNIEYQHSIYTTGMCAMEKVVESLAEKIKSGKPVEKFDEFFDIWIDVSEQAYFQFFQTEEFSRLQGELLDAGLHSRMRLFKVMEMYLYDLPIVLRTEMDDHYRTVYELKKRVKKLEKQLQESTV